MPTRSNRAVNQRAAEVEAAVGAMPERKFVAGDVATPWSVLTLDSGKRVKWRLVPDYMIYPPDWRLEWRSMRGPAPKVTLKPVG